MRKKFLFLGTIAAGVTLYLWGLLALIASLAFPWPVGSVKKFADDRATVEAIREHVPENGVYVSTRGVFLAISVWPDLLDKEEATVGARIIMMFAGDFLVALVLTALFLWIRIPSVVGVSTIYAGLGFSAGVATYGKHWIWYGFSSAYTLMGLSELVVGWLLVGLALTGTLRLMARFNPAAKEIIR